MKLRAVRLVAIQEDALTNKIRYVLAGFGIVAALAVVKYMFPEQLTVGGGPTTSVTANCDAAYTQSFCTKNQKKCNVRVVLSQCGVAPDLVPKELAVCEKNTKITWTLEASGTAAGAVFAYNGIDFTDKTGYTPRYDPKDEFQVKKRGDVSYEVMDKKSNNTAHPDQYGYGIHILKSDKTDCWHQDPMVSNE